MRVTSLFSRRCSLSEHDRISSKLSREKHEHFKSSTLLVVMEHDTLRTTPPIKRVGSTSFREHAYMENSIFFVFNKEILTPTQAVTS